MSSSDGQGPGSKGPEQPATTKKGMPAQADPDKGDAAAESSRAPLPLPQRQPVPTAAYPFGQQPPGASPPAPQAPAPQAPVPHAPASQAPVPHAPAPHAPASQAPVPHAPVPSTPVAHDPSAPVPQAPMAHDASTPYVQDSGAAPPPGGHSSGPGDDEEVPGSAFVNFLKISSKRAFRLRIEPSEVLPRERISLLNAQPPIHDVNLQAFLAWRRSVLFLVAVALLPLSAIGLIDSLAGSMAMPIRVVKLAPAITEALFCWICWRQLKRWAHWRSQRKWLFWGWMLFMATPFIVFLYPLRTVLMDSVSNPVETLRALGVDGTYRRAVMPFVFAMIAMLQLAPKAISLMPGLIRASLVIKLLFPGASAPGWLIVLAAPLYALLAYVILVIPYQFTGSGWFISGVIGVIIGQFILARAGFSLAQPLTEEEALKNIRRVRTYYMVVMIISAVLIVVALGSLVEQFNMRIADVVTAVLKFETNVLILTMIGADLVVTNLDKARTQTEGRAHVLQDADNKIAAFVRLQPGHHPPSGPIPTGGDQGGSSGPLSDH